MTSSPSSLARRSWSRERERLWLVDCSGGFAGSSAVDEKSESEAELRWVLLHPDLRGKGIGAAVCGGSHRLVPSKGLFSDHLLEHMLVEGEVGDQLLQLGLLVLELTQAPDLGVAPARILLLLAIERPLLSSSCAYAEDYSGKLNPQGSPEANA